MQFIHVFHQVELQLRMNLMVFNVQMPLNELNKSSDMLVRILFGKGKRRNKLNAEEEEKGLKENEAIEYPKQRKNNIENNIILY